MTEERLFANRGTRSAGGNRVGNRQCVLAPVDSPAAVPVCHWPGADGGGALAGAVILVGFGAHRSTPECRTADK